MLFFSGNPSHFFAKPSPLKKKLVNSVQYSTLLIEVRAITFCHSVSTLYGFLSCRHGNTGHQA